MEVLEAREDGEDEVALGGRVVEPRMLAGLEVVVLGVVEQAERVARLLHQLDAVVHLEGREACGEERGERGV